MDAHLDIYARVALRLAAAAVSFGAIALSVNAQRRLEPRELLGACVIFWPLVALEVLGVFLVMGEGVFLSLYVTASAVALLSAAVAFGGGLRRAVFLAAAAFVCRSLLLLVFAGAYEYVLK